MIKPGRIIKLGLQKFLPAGLFLLFTLFLLGLVLINSQFFHPSRDPSQIPGLEQQVSLKPYSNESARRYYSILQILSDLGYVRCDAYLHSSLCQASDPGQKNLPLILKEEHFLVDTNQKPVADANKKPYHLLKTLIVKTGTDDSQHKSKYVGIINFTSQRSTTLILNFFKLLQDSKACPEVPINTWYFIEDKILLQKLEVDWRFQFKDPLANLKIVRLNQNNQASDVTAFFKNMENCLDDDTSSQ